MRYYILEIQEATPGSFAHLVHTADDDDPKTALAKGESVFYQTLAAAAISNLHSHSATLIRSDGKALANKCYRKAIEEPTSED